MSRFNFLAFSAFQGSENTQKVHLVLRYIWKGKINKFFSKIAVVSEIPPQVHQPKKQERILCAPLPPWADEVVHVLSDFAYAGPWDTMIACPKRGLPRLYTL